MVILISTITFLPLAMNTHYAVRFSDVSITEAVVYRDCGAKSLL